MNNLSIVVGAAAALASCARPPEHAPAATALPKREVRVLRATAHREQAREEVIGTIRAKHRATLEAKVSGRIARMPIALGQRVRAGELIASLDVAEIQARAQQAQVVLKQATVDRERFAVLLKQNAVTQQEADRVNTSYEVARATLSEAQTLLGYAQVRAPFAGVIAHKLANVGDLATPGRPLVELEDPTQLRFEINVPETLAGLLSIGQALEVSFSRGARPLRGTVVELAPVADPTTRTFLVKLDLPAEATLRAGQFGRAAVPTGRTEVLRVPRRAVVRRGQMELAFVAQQSTARLRIIKTGKRFGDDVEIVAGLDNGEDVVVDGAEQLTDGQAIEIRR